MNIDCVFDCGCGASWVEKNILFKDEDCLERIWFVVTGRGKVAHLEVCPEWVEAYFESIILAKKVFVVWDECHQIVEWFIVDETFNNHPYEVEEDNDEIEFDGKDY
jgi:hypothetical protein